MDFIKNIIPDIEKICDHFGFDNQVVKLDEECLEYVESREPQEIADVFIVSFQLVLKSDVLRELVKQKINRTLERIGSGYYDI